MKGNVALSNIPSAGGFSHIHHTGEDFSNTISAARVTGHYPAPGT